MALVSSSDIWRAGQIWLAARNLPEETALRMKCSIFRLCWTIEYTSGVFYFSLQKKRSIMFKSAGVDEVIVYRWVNSVRQLFRVDKRKSSKSIISKTYSNLTALWKLLWWSVIASQNLSISHTLSCPPGAGWIMASRGPLNGPFAVGSVRRDHQNCKTLAPETSLWCAH